MTDRRDRVAYVWDARRRDASPAKRAFASECPQPNLASHRERAAFVGRCGLKPIAPQTTERAARTILTVRAAPWRASPAKADRRPASEVNAATSGSADRTVETLGPRGARYASRIARTPPASPALAT